MSSTFRQVAWTRAKPSRQSQRGSTAAFNQLVAAYQSLVYQHQLPHPWGRDAAADASQDTFIAAYRGIKGYRGGSFKAWLLRIATNQCYDQLRRKQRRPTASLDSLLVQDDEPPEMPNEPEGPEDHLMRRELHREVQRGLLTLAAGTAGCAGPL